MLLTLNQSLLPSTEHLQAEMFGEGCFQEALTWVALGRAGFPAGGGIRAWSGGRVTAALCGQPQSEVSV